MSVFVLIGGRTNMEQMGNVLEKEILNLSQKKNPIVLYCPYATIKDIDKSIDKFHTLMKDLPCKIIDLTWENIDRFEELLESSDILYISGGCCNDLVEVFKTYGLDKILYKYQNTDKVFAGSSAGAMLFSRASMGDRDMYIDNFHKWNYKMVDCLGILDITICPHYQEEDLVIYNDSLKQYPYDAFGIEEDTMVVIKDNMYYVVKQQRSRSVYYFNADKGYEMMPLYEGVEYEKDCGFRSKGNV